MAGDKLPGLVDYIFTIALVGLFWKFFLLTAAEHEPALSIRTLKLPGVESLNLLTLFLLGLPLFFFFI